MDFVLCVRKTATGAGVETLDISPTDHRWEIFRNDRLIIFFDFTDFDGTVRFGIEVVWVEFADGSEEFLVAFFHKLAISILAVPSVRRNGQYIVLYRLDRTYG